MNNRSQVYDNINKLPCVPEELRISWPGHLVLVVAVERLHAAGNAYAEWMAAPVSEFNQPHDTLSDRRVTRGLQQEFEDAHRMFTHYNRA